MSSRGLKAQQSGGKEKKSLECILAAHKMHISPTQKGSMLPCFGGKGVAVQFSLSFDKTMHTSNNREYIRQLENMTLGASCYVAFTIISSLMTTPCHWLAVSPRLLIVLCIDVLVLYCPPCMTRLSLPDLALIVYNGLVIYLGDPTLTTFASACCPISSPCCPYH